jgi:hypothetical protein
MLTPCANSSIVSGDMIGHCGNMRPDAPRGICQRGSVLDLHAHERIGIVRAPNLWTVIKHAGIKSAAYNN